MGLKLDLLCLCWSLLATLATTAVMVVAVVSNYWESVTYSPEAAGPGAEVLFGGKVIAVSPNASASSEAGTDLLISMHGGLWSLCLDLTGKEGPK